MPRSPGATAQPPGEAADAAPAASGGGATQESGIGRSPESGSGVQPASTVKAVGPDSRPATSRGQLAYIVTSVAAAYAMRTASSHSGWRTSR